MSTSIAAPIAAKTMSGADILVHSLVEHGVEVLFAYPGGCSMPMHQSLTRYRRPNPHHSAPPRAGRRLCRPGLRPHHRQSRRLHGHQRPRRHQPGHRHRRRQAGQHSADRHHRPGADRRDRHRCLSGNADRRSLPRRSPSTITW